MDQICDDSWLFMSLSQILDIATADLQWVFPISRQTWCEHCVSLTIVDEVHAPLASKPPTVTENTGGGQVWVPNHSKPCVCVHIISIYDICRYQIMTLYCMRYTLLYTYNIINMYIYIYTHNYYQYESLRDGCIATSTFGPFRTWHFCCTCQRRPWVTGSPKLSHDPQIPRIFSPHWIQHYIARKYHWGIMTGGVICRFKKHDYLDP